MSVVTGVDTEAESEEVLRDLLETAKKYEETEEQEEEENQDETEIFRRSLQDYVVPCSNGAPSLKEDLKLDVKLERLTAPPEWKREWNREKLIKNREGKGLKQIIEITVQSYQGVTPRLFDKFGTAFLSSGAIYQGPYGEDRKGNGIGRLILPDGTIFDGDIEHGEIGQRGILYWPDGSVYEGNLREGLRNGYGRYFDADSQSFYMGDWLASLMHGYGKMMYYGSETNYYQGSWHAGAPWGKGIRQWPSGNFYEGDWARGLPHGQGTKFWVSGKTFYRGIFANGKPHGYGLMTWYHRQPPNSGIVNQRHFHGMFREGIIHGSGTYTQINGTTYAGQWKNGRKNGKFRISLSNGFIIECIYNDDVIHDPMPRYLLKVNPGKYSVCPLPPVTISQMDSSPFTYNSQLLPIILPGTVWYLSEKFGFSEAMISAEMKGLGSTLGAYMEILIDVYNVYDRLMAETSCDNVYTLRAFQYWQFLTDVVVDRTNNGCDAQQQPFYLIRTIEQSFDPASRFDVFCHPYQPIKLSEFLDRIIVASYVIELEKQRMAQKNTSKIEGNGDKLTWPFKKKWNIAGEPVTKLIERKILKNAGLFKSCLFDDPKKCPVIFAYVSQLFRLYRYIFEYYSGQMEVKPDGLTFRMFTNALRDAHVLDDTGFTYPKLFKIVEEEWPEIREQTTSFSLDVPLTFLSFMGCLVQIALVYDGSLEQWIEAGKKEYSRPPTSHLGKIVQAVDSVLLTKVKKPEMATNTEKPVLDFDAEFFALLRGETDGNESNVDGPNCDDAPVRREIQRQRADLWDIGNSGPKWEDEDSGTATPEERPLVEFPFTNATDYELPFESVPSDAEFAGYSVKHRKPPVETCGSDESVESEWPYFGHIPRTLADIPSMDAYVDVFNDLHTESFSMSLIPDWENKVVGFFENVLFPKMVLFKQVNDHLIAHGLARPLADTNDNESVMDDEAADFLLQTEADSEKKGPGKIHRKPSGSWDISYPYSGYEATRPGFADSGQGAHKHQLSAKKARFSKSARKSKSFSAGSALYRKYLHVAQANPRETVHWSRV